MIEISKNGMAGRAQEIRSPLLAILSADKIWLRTSNPSRETSSCFALLRLRKKALTRSFFNKRRGRDLILAESVRVSDPSLNVGILIYVNNFRWYLDKVIALSEGYWRTHSNPYVSAILGTYSLSFVHYVHCGGDARNFEPIGRLTFEILDKSIQKLRAIYKVHPEWFEVPSFAKKVY